MHIKVCFTKAGCMSQGDLEIDSDSEEETRIAELVPVKIDDNVITTQDITD